MQAAKTSGSNTECPIYSVGATVLDAASGLWTPLGTPWVPDNTELVTLCNSYVIQSTKLLLVGIEVKGIFHLIFKHFQEGSKTENNSKVGCYFYMHF